MKRSSKLKRKTPLRPGKPISPVNRKRSAKMDARNFGDEAERVRRVPCLCWRYPAMLGGVCMGSTQAAHVTARGMGASKGGRFDIVPLCDAHHREAGEASSPMLAFAERMLAEVPDGSMRVEKAAWRAIVGQRAAFEQRYGLDLRAEADRIALEHPRPLGIRGLADRWAPADRQCGECSSPAVYRDEYGEQFCADHGEPLDTYETDALLGWVYRVMMRESARRGFADGPGERELLCDHIAGKLGGSFVEAGPGWPYDGPAWESCEAAAARFGGWPS